MKHRLCFVVLLCSALAGCESNATTGAATAPKSASPTVPPAPDPRGAASLDAKVVPPASSACNSFGASKSRCFASLEDACADIACPKKDCVSTTTLPGQAVCQPR